jgi:hypothetical protein
MVRSLRKQRGVHGECTIVESVCGENSAGKLKQVSSYFFICLLRLALIEDLTILINNSKTLFIAAQADVPVAQLSPQKNQILVLGYYQFFICKVYHYCRFFKTLYIMR